MFIARRSITLCGSVRSRMSHIALLQSAAGIFYFGAINILLLRSKGKIVIRSFQ